MNSQNLCLPRESNILLNRLIQALSVNDIQSSQIVWLTEEHVAPVVQALEALGVVREPHGVVGGRGIAEEDTLNLVREVVSELGVVLHDVAV